MDKIKKLLLACSIARALITNYEAIDSKLFKNTDNENKEITVEKIEHSSPLSDLTIIKNSSIIEGRNFKGSIFSKLVFCDKIFKNCNFKKVKFERCRIYRTKFINTNLKKTNFEDIYIGNSHFENFNLKGATFRKTNICRDRV